MRNPVATATAATNLTCTATTITINFELGRAPWYGRLLNWLDIEVNHPLFLFGRWQNHLPLPAWWIWPFYKFCCWTSRWDFPSFRERS